MHVFVNYKHIVEFFKRKICMSIPKYNEMFNPLVMVLRELGGSGTNEELLDGVIKKMGISEEDADKLHGNTTATELDYRLAWTRTYLKNVGVISNPSRGLWTLTSSGWIDRDLDEDQIVRMVRASRKEKPSETASSIIDDCKELEEMRWEDELLSILKQMEPTKFEQLSGRILRQAGFSNIDITGKSHDGGIDGRGAFKVNDFLSFTICFQCKRYKDIVPASAIRDFRGAIAGRADKGLIITTGTFSSEAKKEARRDGAMVIDIVDGNELAHKLKELRIGVKVENVEKVTVTKDWFIENIQG